VVIRLARPNERNAALRALLPSLPATFGGLAVDTADVLIVPAKWDFAQLDEWRRYLDDHIGSPGVTSIGTDEAANQIRYGVVDAAARTTLERRLREVRVPCGLVAVEIVGVARPAGNSRVPSMVTPTPFTTVSKPRTVRCSQPFGSVA
jgi:hypothetical protein